MLHEGYQSTTLDDIDINQYIKELEGDALSESFDDFKLSNYVLGNDTADLLSMLDEYSTDNNNDCSFDTLQFSIVPTDALIDIPGIQTDNIAIVNNRKIVEDDLEQNFDYGLYEEPNLQQGMGQLSEETSFEINENPFESVLNNMIVKEQPKADQRARYASDGPRFLPDAKKHPMAVQLPDLSSKPRKGNEVYGIILTMVTSTNNPCNETFVHANDIKYRTDDAIEMANGRIFLPITETDMKNCQKIFPRLSIICKKFDDYTFDLTTFNRSTAEIKQYVLENELATTKVAKGKQFTIDYDLLCYKIIFQLAFKRDDTFFISEIKCETNIVNEQKNTTKGTKRKASSDGTVSKKRKDSIDMPMLNSSMAEQPAVRRSTHKTNRFKESSVGSS